MRHAIRSWGWLLLLAGSLLFVLMGADCGDGDCENIEDFSDWLRCVGSDIEDWF
ncbi:MAG: hypothetical protein QUV05_01005 [Phycisphaerae bacterium]|nr:hypothetical protein [Phycisphaerae bacterium]